jgi:glutaredoxin
MKIPVTLAAVILFFLVGDCRGEIFRYKDGSGQIHFVDDISRVPKRYRNQAENSTLQGNINVMDSARSRGDVAGKEPEQTRRNSEYSNGVVDVFVTSWCGYCKKMLRFLREKGIPFTSHDIEKESNAARTYRELGGTGVPVVRIGSHVVHGYNPEAVMEYYKKGK